MVVPATQHTLHRQEICFGPQVGTLDLDAYLGDKLFPCLDFQVWHYTRGLAFAARAASAAADSAPRQAALAADELASFEVGHAAVIQPDRPLRCSL